METTGRLAPVKSRQLERKSRHAGFELRDKLPRLYGCRRNGIKLFSIGPVSPVQLLCCLDQNRTFFCLKGGHSKSFLGIFWAGNGLESNKLRLSFYSRGRAHKNWCQNEVSPLLAGNEQQPNEDQSPRIKKERKGERDNMGGKGWETTAINVCDIWISPFSRRGKGYIWRGKEEQNELISLENHRFYSQFQL